MTVKLSKIAVVILFVSSLIPFRIFAQQPGDTIRVKTFHYASNTRDTMAYFPKGNLTFEKIILRYNMRCKNGLMSDGSNRNKGCGEWDYSCNTFLVDSSKIETLAQTASKYVISNFAGTTFNYTNKPICDYYDYNLKKVTVNSVSNETKYSVGKGNLSIYKALNTAKWRGRPG